MATTNYSVVNEILNFDGLNQFLAKKIGWLGGKTKKSKMAAFWKSGNQTSKEAFQTFLDVLCTLEVSLSLP